MAIKQKEFDARVTALKVGTDYDGDIRVISIEDVEGQTLATLPYTDKGELLANRIVRAVNSFDVLVGALRYARTEIDILPPKQRQQRKVVLQMIDAALAQAGEMEEDDDFNRRIER